MLNRPAFPMKGAATNCAEPSRQVAEMFRRLRTVSEPRSTPYGHSGKQTPEELFPVAETADEGIGGAVVGQRGIDIVQLRQDFSRQHFAQFNTPLIE